MEILVFGQLTDILGGSTLQIDRAEDTDALLELLQDRFPLIRSQKFVIAINQQIISGKVVIPNGSQIALLPPFSGG